MGCTYSESWCFGKFLAHAHPAMVYFSVLSLTFQQSSFPRAHKQWWQLLNRWAKTCSLSDVFHQGRRRPACKIYCYWYLVGGLLAFLTPKYTLPAPQPPNAAQNADNWVRLHTVHPNQYWLGLLHPVPISEKWELTPHPLHFCNLREA